MTKTLQLLSGRWNKLGINKYIDKPYEPENKINQTVKDFFFFESEWAAMWGAILGGVGYVIYLLVDDGISVIFRLFEGKTYLWLIASIAVGAIGLYLIRLLIVTLRMPHMLRIIRKEYSSDLERYKVKLQEYEEEKRLDDLRVQRELREKEVVVKEYNIIKNKLDQSKAFLNRCYNSVGIDPQFRNIVPIGYMNEFLRLGITTKLQGSNGLYYLVKQELHLNAFHYQLSDIASKLDTIIDQNRDIYHELNRLNSQCSQMVQLSFQQNQLALNQSQQLDSIVSNSQIAAYNSQRLLVEQQYENYLLMCRL